MARKPQRTITPSEPAAPQDQKTKVLVCGVCVGLAAILIEGDEPHVVYHQDSDCIIYPCERGGKTVVVGIWKRHGEVEDLHAAWLSERTIGAVQSHYGSVAFTIEMSNGKHLCCEVTLG